MDLTEDKLKWTAPFQLQWVEELGVLGRLRQLPTELQWHIHREGVVGAWLHGKGRRLPEVVVRVGFSRSDGSAADSASVTNDEGAEGMHGQEDSKELQKLAARISGPRSYQWMLGGVPLPNANSPTLGLSEAYELPCALQLQSVSADGSPRTPSDPRTDKLDSVSIWEVGRAVLGMIAGETNDSVAASAVASRVRVKPSPALTCVVWSASGVQRNTERACRYTSVHTDIFAASATGVAHTDEAIVELANTQERCVHC